MTESPSGTSITTVGPAITDSAGTVWSLVNSTTNQGMRVAKGGVADTGTSYVVQLAYSNHVLWQGNVAGGWWSWTNNAWVGNGTTPPAGITPVVVGPPTPVAGQAARAWAFVDSMAINGGASAGGPVAGNNGAFIQAIKYLGIHHIRHGIDGGWGQNERDIAAAGIYIATSANTSNREQTVAIPNAMTNVANFINAGGLVSHIEGPNEPNGEQGNYLWNGADAFSNGAVIRQIQQAIWNDAKANSTISNTGVKVVSASFIVSSGAYASGYGAQVGDLSAWCDWGNWHVYPSSSASQALNYLAPLQGPNAASRAAAVTEIGYTLNNVSATAQAQGLLNFYAESFRWGNPRCYVFDTYNNTGENFAIINGDNSPSQAAVGIHNLTSVLADTGANAKTFTPAILAYSLGGMPTNVTAKDILLQKSNGTYELLLLTESGGPYNVTVNLPASAATVNIYDPLFGSATLAGNPGTTSAAAAPAPIATLSNTSSFQVKVPAYPVIVEIVGMAIFTPVPVPVPVPPPVPAPTPTPTPPAGVQQAEAALLQAETALTQAMTAVQAAMKALQGG